MGGPCVRNLPPHQTRDREWEGKFPRLVCAYNALVASTQIQPSAMARATRSQPQPSHSQRPRRHPQPVQDGNAYDDDKDDDVDAAGIDGDGEMLSQLSTENMLDSRFCERASAAGRGEPLADAVSVGAWFALAVPSPSSSSSSSSSLGRIIEDRAEGGWKRLSSEGADV